MFKKFIPFAYAKSIFDVNIDFFKYLNIKTLLVDLDNTLDSYKCYTPSARVINLKKQLDANEIKLIIISNNRGKRVKCYADSLGVPYLSSTHKPFKKRLAMYLANNGIKNDESMLVGDQLITDVMLGYNAKINVLLCEPIVKEDQWTTRFNRLIDRPIRRYLKNHNKLMIWSDKYE